MTQTKEDIQAMIMFPSETNSRRKKVRAGAESRYQAALADVRTLLSAGEWVYINRSEFASIHNISATFLLALCREGAIESRKLSGRSSEFKSTPSLDTFTALSAIHGVDKYGKEQKSKRELKNNQPEQAQETPASDPQETEENSTLVLICRVLSEEGKTNATYVACPNNSTEEEAIELAQKELLRETRNCLQTPFEVMVVRMIARIKTTTTTTVSRY